jgi:hypothetical protein
MLVSRQARYRIYKQMTTTTTSSLLILAISTTWAHLPPADDVRLTHYNRKQQNVPQKTCSDHSPACLTLLLRIPVSPNAAAICPHVRIGAMWLEDEDSYAPHA